MVDGSVTVVGGRSVGGALCATPFMCHSCASDTHLPD